MGTEIIEAIMEAVCDVCHWPYVVTDQDALDKRCAAYPIERLLKEVGGVTCDAYCQGCYYYGAAHQTCDYWEKADQLRGCPPGKGCTKRITKKEYMKMAAPKKWDKAAGFEMWKAGKTDKDISLALGVSIQAVGMYRKKYWEHGKGVRTQPVPAEQEDEIAQTESVGMETNITEIAEPDDTTEGCEPEAVAEEDLEDRRRSESCADLPGGPDRAGKGRWIRRGNEMKCSNPKCQFIYYSNHDDFNYCPNCGARMDSARGHGY